MSDSGMGSKTIDNYFEKQIPTRADDNSSKRPRSDGSDSSMTSNSPKRVTYDSENEAIDLPKDAPEWVSVLLGAIEKVNTNVSNVTTSVEDLAIKLDNFKTETDTRFAAVIANADAMKADYDNRITELTNSVSFISASFEAQKAINESLSAKIAELVNSNAISSQKANDQSMVSEAHEQYSRRNCLLIHGVAESHGESTDSLVIDTMKKHLAVNLSPNDLDRSHRLGPRRSDGRARPIIIKFSCYNVRASVYAAKRKLKGSNLLITESLTRQRVRALSDAKLKYGKENVWTMDGEILTKLEGKIVNVRNILYA